jgi:biopolymer transport protein ExbB
MKKMNLTCLMAALLLWLGSLAQDQAAAQPPSFAQRCDGWITSNDFFNQEKFERWGKKFDSQPEFKQWLTTLAPKHQARQEKSPMNDDDFNAWLTAEVLAKINSKSLFELLTSGGVLMIPLMLCSIVGVTFTLLRAFEYRRDRLFPAHFLEGLKEKIAGPGGSAEAGRQYCDELIETDRYLAPAARMCGAGLKKAGAGAAVVEEAVENAGNLEVTRLQRGLRVLQVVIAVAPLLGLVGTVYGMIGSFQSVELAELGDDKAKMLSGGIYEALVTTATGLTIAIPMLIIYYFLNTKVDSLADDFNGLALQFMEICPTSGGGTAPAEPGDEAEEAIPAKPTLIA